MRIVVHGQQAFGKAVLEALLKRGENVVAVYVAPEKPGAKADPLKEAALAAKLPIYQPASYKDPAVWEEFKALKPDLQVMAFVTLFVPEEFLNIPTNGSIQYHPSLLPLYRGASAINWPIIKGEKETGLSIFWPDNGLDTGDILVQKTTAISDKDTLGTVYFDRLFPMGVEAMLEAERGELGALDREVLASLEAGETVAANVAASFEGRRTFGDRSADVLASFGGSWGFIFLFTAILLVWMALNVSGLLFRPFDPYPFILLNLVLSTLAALQAPVIMMSQRRQEQRDRLRAENDYKVNLKAELEIRHLHEKIDHQLARQWERLAEMQKVQIEMLEELAADRE